MKQYIKNFENFAINEGWFSDLLTGVKDEDPEKQRFTCEDCGEYNYDMYMVNDEVWKKYGNENATLCKSCLEKRMGRRLKRDDVINYSDALANKVNPYIQSLTEKQYIKNFENFAINEQSTNSGGNMMFNFAKDRPDLVKLMAKEITTYIDNAVKLVNNLEMNGKELSMEEIEKIVSEFQNNLGTDYSKYLDNGIPIDKIPSGEYMMDLNNNITWLNDRISKTKMSEMGIKGNPISKTEYLDKLKKSYNMFINDIKSRPTALNTIADDATRAADEFKSYR